MNNFLFNLMTMFMLRAIIFSLLFTPLSAIAQNRLDSIISAGCFKIQCYFENKLSKTGSGFVLTTANNSDPRVKRYVAITNEHVIDNVDSIILVFSDGKRVEVMGVLHSSHSLDASLIIFETYKLITPLLISSDKSLGDYSIGDDVYTISSPKGLTNSLSQGIISAKNRIIGNNSLIQFTAPISSGSSGGLLINKKSIPIGIIVSQFSQGQNLNFAIPLSLFIQELISYNIIDSEVNVLKNTYTAINGLADYIEQNDLILADISSSLDNKEVSILKFGRVDNEYLTERLLLAKANYLMGDDLKGLYEVFIHSQKKYLSLASIEISMLLTYSLALTKFSPNDIDINLLDVLYNSDDEYCQNIGYYIKGRVLYTQSQGQKSYPYLKMFSDYYDNSLANELFNNDEHKFAEKITRLQALRGPATDAFLILGNEDIDHKRYLSATVHLKKALDYMPESFKPVRQEAAAGLLMLAYFSANDMANGCSILKKYKSILKDVDKLSAYCK